MGMREKAYEILPDPIKNAWRKRKARILPGMINEGLFYDMGLLCKMMDKEKYYSQYAQDFFLDTVIFHGKIGGFFIDIGGNHPKRINNTYYFEEKLAWGG